MMNIFKQIIATFVITMMVGHSAAWAGYVPTTNALEVEQQRTDVMSVVNRPDVQEMFVEKGVSPQEVEQRIAMLTPAQLSNLQNELNNAPAGEGAVGTIIGAALIVFLVLLFTDIIGATDVFNFDD